MLSEDSVSVIIAIESQSHLRHQLACSFSFQWQCLCFWYRQSTVSKTELDYFVPSSQFYLQVSLSHLVPTNISGSVVNTLKSSLGWWGALVDVNASCVSVNIWVWTHITCVSSHAHVVCAWNFCTRVWVQELADPSAQLKEWTSSSTRDPVSRR